MRTFDRIDWNALPYALGAIGLGAVTLVFSDFLLQWQPVPKGFPLREPLALLSGAILIAGGIAALLPATNNARLILAGWFALWALALHMPAFMGKPDIVTLLGFAEILSLAIAGSLLAPTTHYTPLLARLYGLCPLVFGLSHFVYAKFTAMMVPGWIPPSGLFWAYATGAGHAAAGIAILAGIRARLAASLLAAMCGSFVLLLHAPRVFAAPADRVEWTMLFVALTIAGGAWLVRQAFSAR